MLKEETGEIHRAKVIRTVEIVYSLKKEKFNTIVFQERHFFPVNLPEFLCLMEWEKQQKIIPP